MTKRAFKDAIYRQVALAGKSLSSPKRLELLELLAQAPRTVEALATETDTTVANASQHLQILFAAGLVEAQKAQKDGRFVTYRLADDSVGDFLRAFRILAENRRAEIDRVKQRFLAEMGDAEPVDQKTLIERVQCGEAVVLDVRPTEEYRHAHLLDAVCIPLGELEARLSELPPGKQVVAYCRGPFCVLAAEAVRLLRTRGIPAHRLEGSVYDLRAQGLPVVNEKENIENRADWA